MGPGMTKKVKVMIFSIKFNKFTGFFDKFLKSISLASGCNQKEFSYKSECGALKFRAKKSFPAHCAFARKCPHSGARGSWSAAQAGRDFADEASGHGAPGVCGGALDAAPAEFFAHLLVHQEMDERVGQGGLIPRRR